VLKTGAGISEQAYSSTEEQPLYGEGQGTKWADERDIQISIQQSADNQGIDIAQRCCQESHRTLGLHEKPAGIYKTEHAHLLAKRNNMAAVNISKSDHTARRMDSLPKHLSP
jgi:hypothetical protein